MSAFDPMPDLISQQEDNFQQASNRDVISGNEQYASESNSSSDHKDENMSEPEQLAVETKTTSCTHYINWAIDSRSLHIAKLATKGDKRGVIEANVEKDGHRFKLELCASGWRNSQDGYCAFYLTVADQDDLFVARYRVQVGDITRISSIRHDFHLGVGFPNFCQQETLDSIMVDNTVRFLVTVEVFTCSSNVKPPARPPSLSAEQKPPTVISRLIKDMYHNRLHSDVSLICQDIRIPVHKCILAHASPVFRAMFQHNLLETQLNEVRMHDWDTATVLAMVEFLYTAKIPSAAQDIRRPMPTQNSGMEIDDDQFSLGAFPMPSSSSPSPEILASQGLIRSSSLSSTGLDSARVITRTRSDHNSDAEDDDITGLDDDGDDSKMCNVSSFSMNVMTGARINSTSNKSIQQCVTTKTKATTSSGQQQSAAFVGVSAASNSDLGSLTRHTTFKIFQLAEYYKIESLVISCCHQMHRALTVDSACELLIRIERYAHVHEIRCIKESIWEFVTNNIREIKKSNGYSQLMRNHPILLGQLIDKMTR